MVYRAKLFKYHCTMNSFLFYAVLCLLLGTWKIELSIRFAVCYRRTLRTADKLIARQAKFLRRLAHSITGFSVDIQASPQLPVAIRAMDRGARLNTLRRPHALYTIPAPLTKTETADQLEKAQQAITTQLATWHQESVHT